MGGTTGSAGLACAPLPVQPVEKLKSEIVFLKGDAVSDLGILKGGGKLWGGGGVRGGILPWGKF